jgi:small subunit ribosomal protein S17
MTETKTKTKTEAEIERSRRKTVTGTVVSDKMSKTRVVDVERRFRHPFYGKVMKRRSRFYAHDEANESKLGDLVELMETRPLSKLKRWRVSKIVQKAVAAA